MRTWSAGTILAAATALVSTPAFAVVPQAGTYMAAVYVQKLKGACGGGQYSGTSYAGVLDYLGFSAATFSLRAPRALFHQVGVSTQVFSISSGAGTARPAGSFRWKVQGKGVSSDVAGAFSAAISKIDSMSFAVSVNERYTTPYGSCHEALQIGLTRLGSSQ